MPADTSQPLSRFERQWLRAAVAILWLLTGLMVFHPFYRVVGQSYLDRLQVPHGLMPLTCVFEVALGIWILARPPHLVVTLVQMGMVSSFTVILGAMEPMLLVHPFGMLSKNLPFVVLVGVAYRLERHGWTEPSVRWLRAGMAIVWMTEGVFPKILFQQSMEREIVTNSGLVPMDPMVFLWILGALQALSGIMALVLKGFPLRLLLVAQAGALLVLPILVGSQFPQLLFHPFGPYTKNIPVLMGTLLLAWHLGKTRSASETRLESSTNTA